MMALSWPAKDPDEVLDYELNWSARIGDDTISASSWVVDPTGITIESEEFESSSTTLWLSGGSLNQSYSLTNQIETVGGRVMEQTVKIKVKTK